MAATEQRIGEVELDPPLRLPAEATLRAAAGVMEDAGLSCVLVGTGPPRVVTDHDLASAVAAGLPPDAPVTQVATREPVWATTSTTVRDAIGLMTGNGIRHLVVLSPSGEVVGILSLLEATQLLLDAAAPLQPPRRG